MGRDKARKYTDCKDVISTHTPSWGVTEMAAVNDRTIEISTHTPSWGVTGERLKALEDVVISTHTPSWGVTIIRAIFKSVGSFLLTRPRGA